MTTETVEDLPAAPGFIRGPHPARPRKRKPLPKLNPAQQLLAEKRKVPWPMRSGGCRVCGFPMIDLGPHDVHPACDESDKDRALVRFSVPLPPAYRAGGNR